MDSGFGCLWPASPSACEKLHGQLDGPKLQPYMNHCKGVEKNELEILHLSHRKRNQFFFVGGELGKLRSCRKYWTIIGYRNQLEMFLNYSNYGIWVFTQMIVAFPNENRHDLQTMIPEPKHVMSSWWSPASWEGPHLSLTILSPGFDRVIFSWICHPKLVLACDILLFRVWLSFIHIIHVFFYLEETNTFSMCPSFWTSLVHLKE